MSKKSGKGKKSKNFDDMDELNNGLIQNNEVEESSNLVLDIGYLTDAIINYYEATGTPPLDEGDEWKSGTDYEPKPRRNIPKELDEAVKKAFLVQIKKFH